MRPQAAQLHGKLGGKGLQEGSGLTSCSKQGQPEARPGCSEPLLVPSCKPPRMEITQMPRALAPLLFPA